MVTPLRLASYFYRSLKVSKEYRFSNQPSKRSIRISLDYSIDPISNFWIYRVAPGSSAMKTYGFWPSTRYAMRSKSIQQMRNARMYDSLCSNICNHRSMIHANKKSWKRLWFSNFWCSRANTCFSVTWRIGWQEGLSSKQDTFDTLFVSAYRLNGFYCSSHCASAVLFEYAVIIAPCFCMKDHRCTFASENSDVFRYDAEQPLDRSSWDSDRV